MLDIFRPSKWKAWDDNPISNTFKPSHWDSWSDNPIVNGLEDYYNTVTLQDDDDPWGTIPSLTNGLGTSKGVDIANGDWGGWFDFSDPFSNEDEISEAKGTLEQNGDLLGQNFQQTTGLLGNYLDKVNGLYGDSLENRNNALDSYMGIGAYNPDSFSYNKSVNDFMSPAVAMRQKAASDAITKSQANAGNMFSSDYLNALNEKSQAIASEEYDKAFDRYNTDRNASLDQWKANNDENRKAYDSNVDLYKNLLSTYNSDLGNYSNGLSDYYSNLIDAHNAYTEGMSNLNTAIANLEGQKTGWTDNLGGIGSMLGGAAALVAAL